MPATSISPQQWLAAFVVAVAIHVLAGGLFLAFHNAPNAPIHSPRGVMVSLDALSVGNSMQPSDTLTPVTPSAIPSAKPVTAATPQASDHTTAQTPAPDMAPPAVPVAPEPVHPSPAKTANVATPDNVADIPVAKTITIKTANTLQSLNHIPAVRAHRPTQPVPKEHGSGARGRSDNPTLTYIAHVRGWLLQHQYYPLAARHEGIQGTVRLYLVIARDGHVLTASIARSSGSTILDQAALNMVRRAEPLPAMADDLLRTRLAIILPVNFTFSVQPSATK